MRSFRVLAHLLRYPQSEWLDHMDELKTAIADEGFLKGKALKQLLGFMDELGKTELLEAQENYVELFDRGRAHCLHLFEHVHGESRFRGQAMIELAERYKQKGLEIGTGELPDYLPLFLEFVSICDPEDGLETLAQAAPVIATIGEKLNRQGCGYGTVMHAIVTLSGVRLSKAEIAKAADAALPDIKTLDDLDEQWQEPEAFSGAQDCGTCPPDNTQTHGGI